MHFSPAVASLLLFLQIIPAFSQQENLPMNHQLNGTYAKYLNGYDKPVFHSSIKPYLAAGVYDIVYPDTVQGYERHHKSDWFTKLINVAGYENMLEFDEQGYVRHYDSIEVSPGIYVKDVVYDKGYRDRKVYVALNPLLNVTMGYDFFAKKSIYTRQVGAELKLNIGSKVSMYTSFLNTVAKFPAYVQGFNRQTSAVPGEGKSRNTNSGALDFSSVQAYVSYSPVRQFNMQIGHGKHFIGDGYRSLLLSDNAFNYPYLQFTTTLWRIKYVNIFAEFENKIENSTDFTTGFPRKFATFNYLSVDAVKWLQLGVFEGIMWERTTERGNVAFDYNLLNPVLGVRAFQKKLDDHTNQLYGFNLKVTAPRYVVFYGQLAIQQFGRANTVDRRVGYQLGARYFDVGGVKNLNLQVEYNNVRPYMYQGADSALSYAHYNQSITHPMGANFREYLFLGSYQWKRVFVSFKFSYTQTATDLDTTASLFTNYGNNVLESLAEASRPTNTKMFAGSPYTVMDNELRFGYILNPKLNMVIEARLQFRKYDFKDFGNAPNFNSFGITFATQLFNRYYDLPVLF